MTILPKLSPIGGWYKLSSTFTRCRGDEKTRQGLACGPRLAVAGMAERYLGRAAGYSPTVREVQRGTERHREVQRGT